MLNYADVGNDDIALEDLDQVLLEIEDSQRQLHYQNLMNIEFLLNPPGENVVCSGDVESIAQEFCRHPVRLKRQTLMTLSLRRSYPPKKR